MNTEHELFGELHEQEENGLFENEMNIFKSIQYFLVWIKVVKHKGKKANGQYITTGINRKNPLSYVVLFIACLVVGVLAFFKESIDAWKSSW